MAETQFLEGEITERFLASAEQASLENDGGQMAFLTPTIILSIMLCPAVLAASYAWCTA